jgi:hypothetical protein
MRISGFLKRLFGSIAPENVDTTLRDIRKAWFMIAAIQSFFLIMFIWSKRLPLGDLIEPISYLIAAYYLAARRSRAVAAILFCFAAGALGMTIAAQAGLVFGGRNLVLALIIFAVGARGVQATWVYHRAIGSTILWKRTILVAVGTAIAAIFGIAIAWVGMESLGLSMEDENVMSLVVNATVLVVVAVLMPPLTARYPFAATGRSISG